MNGAREGFSAGLGGAGRGMAGNGGERRGWAGFKTPDLGGAGRGRAGMNGSAVRVSAGNGGAGRGNAHDPLPADYITRVRSINNTPLNCHQ